MLYRDIALLGTLVLKLYVNVIQSSVYCYQIIIKTFLSPSRFKPATDVVCHDISVSLPTLSSTLLFLKTESCIREPIIRNQLLFHALYLSDDRVRLICLFFCASTVNMPSANGQQISVGNTKSSENSQTIALSCAYRTNINIKWLRKSPVCLINSS